MSFNSPFVSGKVVQGMYLLALLFKGTPEAMQGIDGIARLCLATGGYSGKLNARLPSPCSDLASGQSIKGNVAAGFALQATTYVIYVIYGMGEMQEGMGRHIADTYRGIRPR